MTEPGSGTLTPAPDRPAAPDPTPAPTPTPAWRRLRVILAAVFVLGTAHAALYAVSFPPWAIEDEEQHVDYAWKLAFERTMPGIDDPVAPEILEAAAGTDRWGDYGLARPPSLVPSEVGMEAYSYEAYHPPLAYVVLGAAAWPFGERALVSMYVLRGVCVVVAGAVAALTALLAWRWCRDRDRGHGGDRRPLVAAAAGVATAALPALAEAGGRANIDVFAALVAVGTTLLAWRWLDEPGPGRAWAVGAALAAGALTRETSYVAGVAVLVVGVAAWRRGRLGLGDVARALGPPAVALAAWATFYRRSTGYIDPSQHIRDVHGAHHPFLGGRDFVRDLGERALVPYGDWSAATTVLTVVVAAVAVAGLALGARHWWRTAERGAALPALTAGATLALALALVFQQAREGSTTMSARLLLPAYPAVVAASVVGWGTLRRAAAVAALPAATVTGAALFLAASFWPLYPPALG